MNQIQRNKANSFQSLIRGSNLPFDEEQNGFSVDNSPRNNYVTRRVFNDPNSSFQLPLGNEDVGDISRNWSPPKTYYNPVNDKETIKVVSTTRENKTKSKVVRNSTPLNKGTSGVLKH